MTKTQKVKKEVEKSNKLMLTQKELTLANDLRIQEDGLEMNKKLLQQSIKNKELSIENYNLKISLLNLNINEIKQNINDMEKRWVLLKNEYKQLMKDISENHELILGTWGYDQETGEIKVIENKPKLN